MMKNGICRLMLCLPLFFLFGCGKVETDQKKIFHTSVNKLIATLDPALAADTACQFMTASFYDTPLQYSFSKRPYELEPSMLERMPEISEDGCVITCNLRRDLLFQKSPCFKTDSERVITAKDMIFSILRLADSRVQSTGYWLIRGKIRGMEQFRERTMKAEKGDFSPYDSGCSGLEIVDPYTFRIHLNDPDPRFVYAMAMPYFSVVSRKAVAYYGDSFADHPCGSGPFLLESWQKDHQIRLRRNPEYRTEYYTSAENPSDRTKKLPLCDEIICDLVKQPMSGWLLFLQGNLDSCALDGENFAAVVDPVSLEIPPTLKKRGIQLLMAPEMQINYIGFSFGDPLLAQNENLRKAISLAFNKKLRIEYGAGKLFPAHGPVPPGAEGYLEHPGTFTVQNIPLAKEYMKKAGFPDGIDPKTGKPLVLTFDQAGSDTFYLQTAELLSIDLKEIGIELKPEFNNRARFLQKLANNQVQLFRLSWTGDYPDAENFLQLFYGPNAGASNRVRCDFPDFNQAYERIRNMGPSAERTGIYLELAEMIREKCPWIFESYTVSFQLKHCWLENIKPHDFAFQRWKYISLDPEKRSRMKQSFTPLSLGELRGKE